MNKKNQLTENVQVTVGRNVRRLRKEAGMSQSVVADRCEIFRTYLSRIEGGTSNPTIIVVAALATCLNVEVGELFKE